MVKRKRLVIRILLLILLAASIIFALKFSGDVLIAKKVKAFDITMPTSAKLAKVAKWIPAGTDFYASVDTWRIFDTPLVGAAIISKLEKEGGAAAELLKGFLAKGDTVGLLSAVISVGETGEKFPTIFIMQGDFDKNKIITEVREALGPSEVLTEIFDEKSGISTFCEESEDSPYCFRFLDDEHMAIGEKESLSRSLDGLPRTVVDDSGFPEGVIYGYLRLTPDISKVLGDKGGSGKTLYFVSQKGMKLTATISTDDVASAANLKDALEGMRSLLILQNPDNPNLISLLNGVSIENDDAYVRISTALTDLLMR